LLAEEAHEYCVRFFTLFPFFVFCPKPTSKSGKRRISSTIASLAEEAHEYFVRFFTLFPFFVFRPKPIRVPIIARLPAEPRDTLCELATGIRREKKETQNP